MNPEEFNSREVAVITARKGSLATRHKFLHSLAHDVAETTRIERPPRGREEVPVIISRLLDAHQIIIRHCRELAERADKLGDQGTNDMVVSDVLRGNELQAWFLSEHLVSTALVHAGEETAQAAD